MLKGKSSAGFDDIPKFLVKCCMKYNKKPLTHVFNISLKSGIFPNLMKIAKVRPLLKRGDKLEIQNYRPVSVPSVFSEILEKIIHHRLLSFLTKFNILTEEQNGFRHNRSTETACHTFIEDVQRALDKNLHVAGIFLDLTKAYYVINHEILLDKLESYGIRDNLKLWFKLYLSQRIQYVSLTQTNRNNTTLRKFTSSSRINPYGVPQGSIFKASFIYTVH